MRTNPGGARVGGVDRFAGECVRRYLRQHAGERHAAREQPAVDPRELTKGGISRLISVSTKTHGPSGGENG